MRGQGVEIAALRSSGSFLLALVVASLVSGCGASADAQDLSEGKKVDLGGWSLYLECKGAGSPTVVLDAGLHDSHTGWAGVEPAAARKTRTCSYDRAGVGLSDLRPSKPPVVPAEQVVDELQELLSKADVPPPYVLVGHSLGGLNARLFAARHARDLAGIVFVDPTSPEYYGRGQSEPERDGAAMAYDTAYDTGRSVKLGNRPAVVLFSSEQRALSEREAKDLAKRSSNSLLVRTEAGHRIHSEQPKLVAEAIDLVVDSARTDAALPACGSTKLERFGGQCLEP